MTNDRKPAKLKLTVQAETFRALQDRLTHDLGVQVSLAMVAEMSAAHYLAWLTDPAAVVAKEKARAAYVERLENAYKD